MKIILSQDITGVSTEGRSQKCERRLRQELLLPNKLGKNRHDVPPLLPPIS